MVGIRTDGSGDDLRRSEGGGKILVVDDDPGVRRLVAHGLRQAGFEVDEAADGSAALSALAAEPPALVVLDVMMPAIGGLDVLAHVRRSSQVPIILLTARAAEVDRVLGLEMGADDYVVKPFSLRELVARIRSVLRRAAPPRPPRRLTFEGLVIDLSAREVWVDGELVALTPLEFDLLVYLASSPRQVFTREQLLEQVWRSSAGWQTSATVTEHVRRLRRKIEADADRPRRLQTVRGVGYRFEP